MTTLDLQSEDPFIDRQGIIDGRNIGDRVQDLLMEGPEDCREPRDHFLGFLQATD